MIHYITGDATVPQCDGHKIITHVCNDVGAWGAGFVLALSARWKGPEANYRVWHSTRTCNGRPFALGEVQFTDVSPDITVANMVAQTGTGWRNGPPIRYDALEKCLESVASDCIMTTVATVHMPRIGCGLAGGKWEIVEQIIDRTLVANGIDVYVYDLPLK